MRYLDAWTPAALHSRRRATYVEGYADTNGGASAIAAMRVFGEFADLLERQTLTMALVGEDSGALRALEDRLAQVATEYGSPAGLTVHIAAGGCAQSLVPALQQVKAAGSPIFAWFDSYGSTAPPFAVVAAVAGSKGSEVLLSLDPAALGDAAPYPELIRDWRQRLGKAGLDLAAHVELVDAGGQAQLLIFATSAEKGLDTFKNELWALDEYAGIRYRDPLDEERTLLDISLQPNLGPLRRALTQRTVEAGQSTVASLRAWTVRETPYRSADATKAVQALLSVGAVERDPPTGRLSPDTMIRPKEHDDPVS